MTVAWIDVDNNEYSLSDISDEHLLNILNFINRGGGYDSFVTVPVVGNLYSEAIERGLKPKYKLRQIVDNRFIE